ncbi:MAG: vWA domain-containing protein, partial [Anaerolineae bacterium]
AGAIFTLGRDGWVRRYDRSGALTAAFDATRFDVATASSPSDLDVTPDGDVLVTDRDADIVTVFRWNAVSPAVAPPERSAVCRNFADKQASPASVDLGAEVEVRLTVRGGCGSDTSTEPLDIIMALDRSGSMEGDKLRVLKGAALNFVADIDLESSRVAVVSFAAEAKTDQGLTDNPELLRTAILGLDAAGDTRVDLGLAEARAEIGRRGRREAHAVFVVLSDGGSDFDDAKRQADLAKDRGVEIYSVGIQAWAELMREIASGSDHYFAADSARFLYGIFDRIAERVTTATLFRSIEVVDVLPGNMRYVADSAVPPAAWDAGTRTLTWTLADVPFNGFGLRFSVEPTQAGEWPTNVSASGDYVDGYDQPGVVSFPVPRVQVIAPTPTPVTPTVTPVESATPRVTETATPRPTRPPRPVFVPVALKERCVPGQKHADVMLVIDASSSMAGDKIDAAKDAAKQFVRGLTLPLDQAGVVAFSSEAWVVSPLAVDASQLDAAIDELRTGTGTRIDLALIKATAELDGPLHAEDNSRVIVLLTDGQQEDAEAVRAAARAARGAGVIIFSIGLGEDVDVDLLEAVAGGRAQTYLAPGPEDLADIYSSIAVQVPCPPKRFWGGR